jgi:exopolysaccharide biosynthesis polyprenyl glycosylphosphotransferase
LVAIVPIWTVLLRRWQAYASFRITSFVSEVFTIAKTVTVGGLLIGTIAFASKSSYISRSFILTFILVNFVLLVSERFFVRAAAWFVRKRGYNTRNVLIVGTDEMARDIAERIKNFNHHWGLRILGFVGENGGAPPVNCLLDDWPVMGNLRDLESIVKRESVDEVIFAVPAKRLEALEDTLLMLEDYGINARIVANIFPHVIAKLHLEELETVPLLTFTTTPTDTGALMVKRFFDLAMGTVVFLTSFPIMLVTAVLIKATSPGPVLFKQIRSGLYGRTFTLYKFRSMFMDAEERKKELTSLNEMEGPVFKIRNDPRVTPVGRFIRKTSIDELPQLWNVLNGDMSLVGPRPPLPEEVAQYDRWQRRRLSMRPGLTCLWQISGRNNVRKFDDWVKMDLLYIDTWSLRLDMEIFLKTIPVVLFRKGAA